MTEIKRLIGTFFICHVREHIKTRHGREAVENSHFTVGDDLKAQEVIKNDTSRTVGRWLQGWNDGRRN